MEFKDRVANKPNRVKLTYEDSGASAYATVEMADEPIESGTPLNKATFDEMQKELMPAFEDSEYKGCYYRWVDGEKEWINPPMNIYEEYRTTEKFQGHVVYRQLLRIRSDDINELLNEGQLNITTLLRGVLLLKFHAWTDSFVLPYQRINPSGGTTFRRMSANRSGDFFYEQTIGLEKPTNIWIEAWYYKK
jgi:hypothetical protein